MNLIHNIHLIFLELNCNHFQGIYIYQVYFHNQNILNIADFIEKEKEALIDKKDNNNNKTYKIEDAIKEIETKREKEDDIIEELNKYGILLDNEIINRNELNLILRVSNKNYYAQLKDEGNYYHKSLLKI